MKWLKWIAAGLGGLFTLALGLISLRKDDGAQEEAKAELEEAEAQEEATFQETETEIENVDKEAAETVEHAVPGDDPHAELAGLFNSRAEAADRRGPGGPES